MTNYQQEESQPLTVQYQTLTPEGSKFFAQLEQSHKEITDHILAGFGIRPNLLKPRLEDMTPACPHLQGFLLATAYEAWDAWYPVTRLIFADWLEEQGDARQYKVRGEVGDPLAVFLGVLAGDHRAHFTIPIYERIPEGHYFLLWEQWTMSGWVLRNKVPVSRHRGLSIWHVYAPAYGNYRMRMPGPFTDKDAVLTITLCQKTETIAPTVAYAELVPLVDPARWACRKRVLDLFANEVVFLPADKGNLVGRVLAGNLLPAG